MSLRHRVYSLSNVTTLLSNELSVLRLCRPRLNVDSSRFSVMEDGLRRPLWMDGNTCLRRKSNSVSKADVYPPRHKRSSIA